MVKIFGDERSFWAADRCMQIHGGMGLSKELPIERFFRDQRSMMITEGADRGAAHGAGAHGPQCEIVPTSARIRWRKS